MGVCIRVCQVCVRCVRRGEVLVVKATNQAPTLGETPCVATGDQMPHEFREEGRQATEKRDPTQEQAAVCPRAPVSESERCLQQPEPDT